VGVGTCPQYQQGAGSSSIASSICSAVIEIASTTARSSFPLFTLAA
jgi:hypothetical protein